MDEKAVDGNAGFGPLRMEVVEKHAEEEELERRGR